MSNTSGSVARSTASGFHLVNAILSGAPRALNAIRELGRHFRPQPMRKDASSMAADLMF